MEKQLTGYPSVDKPWLKYYSEEAINTPLPECSIYEYLWQNNKDHKSEIAINYLGKKITYAQLFCNIDLVAGAFLSLNVKPGEIVTVALPSIPEALYCIYALNKIGAVVNMIHPLAGKNEIIHYLNEVDSRIAVFFEGTCKIVGEAISQTKVEHVIVASVGNSLPIHLKCLYNLKTRDFRLPQSAVYSLWKDFIVGQNSTAEVIDRDVHSVALISHTGGTTGEPKGVMCSDYNVNAVIWQVGAALPHKRQERILVVLPPFINYSLVNSMLEPLALGIQVIMLPEFKADQLDKIINKYHPNHINSIPPYWEAILKNPNMRKTDLSCLKYIYYGGEGMNPELEKEVSDLLVSGGAQLPLCKGFGETELISSATLSFGDNNIIGSVGVPLVKVECKIVKEGTQEEVQCGQEGEICFAGPTLMISYYNNQEETDEIIKVHKDGKRWIHTGDIGHMTDDGILLITGRIKRILITRGEDGNSTKMFPDRIEKTVLKHPATELCCVIGIPDKFRINYPRAYVVLKNEIEQTDNITEEILTICRNDLPEYLVPTEIVYRDSLPRTARGKIDYRALEEEATLQE